MKKVLIVLISLFASVSLLAADGAKPKKAEVAKCFKKCRIERKQCTKEARKSPKSERKAKFAECKKAHAECRRACRKPAAEESAEK